MSYEIEKITETLIGVKPGDSESLDLQVRRKALENFARNEGILFGRVSRRTAEDLLRLEAEELQLSSCSPR